MRCMFITLFITFCMVSVPSLGVLAESVDDFVGNEVDVNMIHTNSGSPFSNDINLGDRIVTEDMLIRDYVGNKGLYYGCVFPSSAISLSVGQNINIKSVLNITAEDIASGVSRFWIRVPIVNAGLLRLRIDRIFDITIRNDDRQGDYLIEYEPAFTPYGIFTAGDGVSFGNTEKVLWTEKGVFIDITHPISTGYNFWLLDDVEANFHDYSFSSEVVLEVEALPLNNVPLLLLVTEEDYHLYSDSLFIYDSNLGRRYSVRYEVRLAWAFVFLRGMGKSMMYGYEYNPVSRGMHYFDSTLVNSYISPILVSRFGGFNAHPVSSLYLENQTDTRANSLYTIIYSNYSVLSSGLPTIYIPYKGVTSWRVTVAIENIDNATAFEYGMTFTHSFPLDGQTWFFEDREDMLFAQFPSMEVPAGTESDSYRVHIWLSPLSPVTFVATMDFVSLWYMNNGSFDSNGNPVFWDTLSEYDILLPPLNPGVLWSTPHNYPFFQEYAVSRYNLRTSSNVARIHYPRLGTGIHHQFWISDSALVMFDNSIGPNLLFDLAFGSGAIYPGRIELFVEFDGGTPLRYRELDTVQEVRNGIQEIYSEFPLSYQYTLVPGARYNGFASALLKIHDMTPEASPLFSVSSYATPSTYYRISGTDIIAGLNQAKDFILDAPSNIWDFLLQIKDFIYAQISSLYTSITGVLRTIWTAIFNVLEWVYSNLVNIITRAMAFVLDVIDYIGSMVLGMSYSVILGMVLGVSMMFSPSGRERLKGGISKVSAASQKTREGFHTTRKEVYEKRIRRSQKQIKED